MAATESGRPGEASAARVATDFSSINLKDEHDVIRTRPPCTEAKVYVVTGPVGALGDTDKPTQWINVYRTDTGFFHGSPGGVASKIRCK